MNGKGVGSKAIMVGLCAGIALEVVYLLMSAFGADESLAFALCVIGLVTLMGSILAAVIQQRKLNERPRPAPEMIPQHQANELNNRLMNSDDLDATLMDIVRSGGENEAEKLLIAMLDRIGFSGWPRPIARLSATYLLTSDGWYVTAEQPLNEDSDDGEGPVALANRALDVESALCTWALLRRRGTTTADDLSKQIAWVFSNISDAEPARTEANEFHSSLMMKCGAEGGEWRCRAAFASFAEALELPFHMSMRFRVNLDKGILCVETRVPNHERFAITGARDAGQRIFESNAYTLRLAMALARGAFDSSESVTRVVVNCLEESGPNVLLSVDVDRDSFAKLRVASGSTIKIDALARSTSLRAKIGDKAALVPIEPFMRLDDPVLDPPARWKTVVLDERPCDENLKAAFGAELVRDLGVYSVRDASWTVLSDGLPDTTPEVASRFSSFRNSTDDPDASASCERVLWELVEGKVEPDDEQGIGQVYLKGSPLDIAADKGSQLLEKASVEADQETRSGLLELALSTTDDALLPVLDAGTYADDDENVWRFFADVSERLQYNLEHTDDARRVRTLPEAYCVALTVKSYALAWLGRDGEVDATLDELMRVSPNGLASVITRAEIMRSCSRPFEAESILKEHIMCPPSVRALTEYLEKLASVKWQVGNHKAAMLCLGYAMKIAKSPTSREYSAMRQMITADPSVRGFSLYSAKQYPAALRAENIETDSIDSVINREFPAAAACVDAGHFGEARGLLLDLEYCFVSDSITALRRSLDGE